jgi:hypothetical protein
MPDARPQITLKKDTDRGSIWRKWDLHIHAPGTKLSNAFGQASDAVWTKFIEQLEASDVQAFGITDYFSFDTYRSMKSRYEQLIPHGKKLIIPKHRVSPDRNRQHGWQERQYTCSD